MDVHVGLCQDCVCVRVPSVSSLCIQLCCVLCSLLQQVHLIVNRALKRYSEDRVGMVDYALESGGR